MQAHATNPLYPDHAKESYASNAKMIDLHAVVLLWGFVCQAVWVQFSFISFHFLVLLSTPKGLRTVGSQPQNMSNSKLGSIYYWFTAYNSHKITHNISLLLSKTTQKLHLYFRNFSVYELGSASMSFLFLQHNRRDFLSSISVALLRLLLLFSWTHSLLLSGIKYCKAVCWQTRTPAMCSLWTCMCIPRLPFQPFFTYSCFGNWFPSVL